MNAVEAPVTRREFMARLGVKSTRFGELKRGGFLPKPMPIPGHPRWSRTVVEQYLSSGRRQLNSK